MLPLTRRASLTVFSFFIGCTYGVQGLEPARLDAGTDTQPPPDTGVLDPPDSGVEDTGDPVRPDSGPPGAPLLILANEFEFALFDLESPESPRPLDANSARDEEPLPLYSLASDRRQIYAGRLGHIGVYTVTETGAEYVRSIDLSSPGSNFPEVHDLVLSGARLYAALGPEGIAIFDVSNLDTPVELARIPAERSVFDLTLIDRDHLLTYDGSDPGIRVYNVADPSRPWLEQGDITDWVSSRSSGLAYLDGVAAANLTYSFGGDRTSGLWFWDLRDLSQPSSFGFNLELSAPFGNHVALWRAAESTFGFFANAERGLIIAEAVDYRSSPLSRVVTDRSFHETVIANDHLYAAASRELAVYRLDPDAPLAPELRTVLSIAIDATSMTLAK